MTQPHAHPLTSTSREGRGVVLLPMHRWPAPRRKDATLIGTLGGPQYLVSICLSQKRKFITQSVGRKRMKSYPSPHLNRHCQTTQYHDRRA